MAQAPSEPVYRLRMAAELEGFYLDVPVDIVSSLCLHPVKYLRFLGYCIFGVDGTIAKDGFDGDTIPDGDPLDQGVYYFVREGIEGVLEHAVDPEAMTYSHISETTNTRDNFRTVVAERDVLCTFTNSDFESSQGIHIVPFIRGDAWMKYIVESRIPEEREDVSNLTSINDIRNGMLVSNNLHPLIDRKKMAVLKTPNPVLTCADIPPRGNINNTLLGGVKYSRNPRYTLQWLVQGTPPQQRDIPNNMDAAFKTRSRKPKPSALLLHYNYGVAALKWWGKGLPHLLTARKRPAPPIAAPLGPSRSRGDRSVTTRKLADARRDVEGLQGSSGAQDDIDDRRQSEAEQLVFNLYANAPAARRRRAEQQKERKDRMAQWQSGLRVALGT